MAVKEAFEGQDDYTWDDFGDVDRSWDEWFNDKWDPGGVFQARSSKTIFGTFHSCFPLAPERSIQSTKMALKVASTIHGAVREYVFAPNTFLTAISFFLVLRENAINPKSPMKEIIMAKKLSIPSN